MSQYAQQNEFDVFHLAYEHQQDQNETLNEGIIAYECFLLYYELALNWCAYPYASQTVGSCICVKSSAYVKGGGMNKRKAGEDFYFIQKLMPFCSFKEIFETTVYPSARISYRVPFGTGKAQNKYSSDINFITYSFSSFKEISHLFNNAHSLFTLNDNSLLSSYESLRPQIRNYISKELLLNNILSIKENVDSSSKFKKRFFTSWWNAFNIMKFLHFSRDNYYPDESIHKCLNELNSKINIGFNDGDELIQKLKAMRAFKAEHSAPNHIP
ncbi:MAG TPA: hypothetical protein EYQ86_02195 [Bacteroidetes bacterium]|nr:hypothetical protein [Bacteroidota bacterium]